MSPDTVNIVMAADEGFALPLAVTVRSLLETIAGNRSVHLFIIDGGITPTTAERLHDSWNGYCLETTFVQPDFDRLKNLSTSGHVSLGTYFRLLIPEVLPRDVSDVIYLDADLLIRRDIGRLWDESVGDAWCLAAQDCAAPFMNALDMLPNVESCARFLAAVTPVPNYQELGLSGQLPYYNCGILRVNLSKWREFGLTERLVECLRQNADSLLWWDQYALNVVMAEHWGDLDLRWNQGSHIFRYPDWQSSPFQQPVFEDVRNDPWIVHFSSPVKPWHAWCRHPFRNEFFAVLDRTSWKGVRPRFSEYVTDASGICWSTLLRLCRLPFAAYAIRRRR